MPCICHPLINLWLSGFRVPEFRCKDLRFRAAGVEVSGCHHDPLDVSRGGATPLRVWEGGRGFQSRGFQGTKGLFSLGILSPGSLKSETLSLARSIQFLAWC